jgi:hypothetical protein
MQTRNLARRILPFLLTVAAVGCNDDPPPTGGSSTTTTTAAASSARARLRGAQLSEDARTVDFAVNGTVVGSGMTYGEVSAYTEVDPGEYRVQFLPSGTASPSLVETTVTLSAGQLATVGVIGPDLSTITTLDSGATHPNRARLKMVNVVPDYPAAFDLSIQNGPRLFAGIRYRETSDTAELIPGVYGFELFRGGTSEAIADTDGQGMSSGANYTVYAIGSLARNNIELLVTRDTF